jgi:uncharacterized protein with FMN-binding domain
VSSAVVVEILLGLLTAVVAVAAYLSASRANREQAKAAIVAVDAGAYTRAREIYEGALGTLRVEVEGMRMEIVRLRESNELLREEIVTLHREIVSLGGDK